MKPINTSSPNFQLGDKVTQFKGFFAPWTFTVVSVENRHEDGHWWYGGRLDGSPHLGYVREDALKITDTREQE